MSEKIVFLTDSWIPGFTINGIIVKNIIEELADTYDIKIISFRQSRLDEAYYKNVRIEYLEDYPFYENQIKLKLKDNRMPLFQQTFYKMLLYAVRIYSYTCRQITLTGINFSMAQKAEKRLKKVLSSEHADYVIAIIAPYDFLHAMHELSVKYKNTKFIVYQADRFISSENNGLPFLFGKLRKRRRIRYLEELTQRCYRYYMTDYLLKEETQYFRNKGIVKRIGFPLIIEKKNDKPLIWNQTDTECTSFVYTGSLLKAVRPPDDSFRIIQRVLSRLNIKLHYYHRGDCSGIVEKIAEKYPDHVVNHGTVSAETAYAAMLNADILICISTFSGRYVAGKTFDYISTGKPVVFFYYNSKDINIPYFKKYELALCLKMKAGNEERNAEKLCRFIKEKKGKKVPFSVVKEKFCEDTPETAAKKLLC